MTLLCHFLDDFPRFPFLLRSLSIRLLHEHTHKNDKNDDNDACLCAHAHSRRTDAFSFADPHPFTPSAPKKPCPITIKALKPSPLQILTPLAPKKPSPITINGPVEIDSCASLSITASVESARPLTYTWRSATNQALNSLLLPVTGATFELNSGTPDLAAGTYTFTVFATDFLGISSDTVQYSLTKKAGISPTLFFFGLNAYQRKDVIIIR